MTTALGREAASSNWFKHAICNPDSIIFCEGNYRASYTPACETGRARGLYRTHYGSGIVLRFQVFGGVVFRNENGGVGSHDTCEPT